jgi:hypothetical protein
MYEVIRNGSLGTAPTLRLSKLNESRMTPWRRKALLVNWSKWPNCKHKAMKVIGLLGSPKN